MTRRRRGDCAEVAARIVLDEQPDTAGTLLLAHGYPVGRGPENGGVRYFHAWVETADGSVVIDRWNGLDVTVPRSRDYRLGGIVAEDVVRYTRDEVVEHIVHVEKTWGPW